MADWEERVASWEMASGGGKQRPSLMSTSAANPPKLMSTSAANKDSGEWGPGGPSGATGYPGAYGENRYLETQDQYDQPGAAEQYWSGLMGKYNPGSTPQSTNNAYDAYARFRDQQPVNMNPYYDNARREATQGIDQSMAARGMYGASAATNRIADTIGDIGAQQSRDEAQYQLQRGGLEGQLARGADLSSLSQAQNELGWIQGLGGLAGQAQNAQLRRLLQGQDAAFGAQNAYENALMNEFNRNFALQNAMAGLVMPTYENMISTDMVLAGMIPEYEMGGAAQAENMSTYRGQKQKDDFDFITDQVPIWGMLKG